MRSHMDPETDHEQAERVLIDDEAIFVRKRDRFVPFVIMYFCDFENNLIEPQREPHP
jgi:hypothetical protein